MELKAIIAFHFYPAISSKDSYSLLHSKLLDTYLSFYNVIGIAPRKILGELVVLFLLPSIL